MSFKENFTRDESKDDVQYDDSAFYTFGGTMLLCFILPLAWMVVKRFFVRNHFKDEEFKNCKCSICEEKIENLFLIKQKKAKNKTFYFMIILLGYLTYNCYFEIKANSNSFKTFNPFEILEIEPDSSEQQIKKAYKRLALKYHPDRNPNNLQAKAKFILLTKAYESLTDETARKNFELYGNPDGPGSMRLAVGLPSFVLNKKNHMPILILFLIFIVIILPGFVLYWFNSTNNYDDAGVQINNHRIYYELLNENILLRQMPFILGSSCEFSGITVKSAEVEELKKLYRKYSELMPKHKEEFIPMGNKKAICLMYAYLDEQQLTNDSLVNELNQILEIAPSLTFTMYQVSRQYTYLKEMQEIQMKSLNLKFDQKMIVKNFGLGCIKVILEFSQIIIQKQAFKASPLLQLPHVTEGIIKNNKALNKFNKNLLSFLALTDKEKKEILGDNFNENQINDILLASQSIPNYKIDVDISVDGFEEILKEDYVTLKIKITRNNLDDKQVYLKIFFCFK